MPTRTHFVHTPGRCGSFALWRRLQEVEPSSPAFHSHLWTWTNLNHLVDAPDPSGRLRMVWRESVDAAIQFRAAIARGEEVAVHWINRDPVARSVSLLHFLNDNLGQSYPETLGIFQETWERALLGDDTDLLAWLVGAYRWHEALEVPRHPRVTVYRHRQETLAGFDGPKENVGRPPAVPYRLPADILDAIYGDPSVTRDYDAAEIETFKARWAE